MLYIYTQYLLYHEPRPALPQARTARVTMHRSRALYLYYLLHYYYLLYYFCCCGRCLICAPSRSAPAHVHGSRAPPPFTDRAHRPRSPLARTARRPARHATARAHCK